MLEIQNLLLAGIGGVTTALVFVCKLLWSRSEECEKDRRELRTEIESVKSTAGVATGTLAMYQRCPTPGCPFRATSIVGSSVVVAIILMLTGCATRAPRTDTAALGAGLARTRASVESAQGSVRGARTLAQRIDDKAVVVLEHLE
jgi:hypothetical protein